MKGIDHIYFFDNAWWYSDHNSQLRGSYETQEEAAEALEENREIALMEKFGVGAF